VHFGQDYRIGRIDKLGGLWFDAFAD